MASLAQPPLNTEGEAQEASTLVVNDASRMPRFSLTMAWWAVCSAMFYIVVGVTLALNYGTLNAVIGMLMSVVSYGIINSIISRYAIKTGLSVALFSRQLFGQSGAALATLIFFATAIYYAVFEGSVIAVAIHHLFPNIAYAIAALIVVLYSVPLIFGSVQHWLDKFNGILLPFYLLGLGSAVAYATIKYGYNDNWLKLGPAGGAPATGWWNCAVYYMGVWILMMFTFDYARFGRKEDATYHGRFNFGMPFYLVTFLLNGLAGIYLVGILPHQGAINEVTIAFGLIELMGVAGLAFVWITQTRINTANYFLATTNMQAFFDKLFHLRLGKVTWGIIVGVLVYLLMLVDVFAYILQALAYQGVFVVAWVAIALTHIVFGKDKQPMLSQTAGDPAFNISGLLAWLAGSVIGIILMNLGAGWANWYATLTFVISAGIYWVSLRSGKTAKLMAS